MNLARTMYRFLVASGVVLWRRAPYIFFSFLCLYGSGFLLTKAYYRYMPAGWFLAITDRPRIDNGSVNKDLTLSFCRKTRYPDIKAVSTRSFYSIKNSGVRPAGEYTFQATIESGSRCQTIAIKSSRHPNVAGRYSSHTETTFYVNGIKKVLSYDTNQFTISDTADSLQKQIQELQQQINLLKGQLSQTDPAITNSLAAPVIASSQAVPPGLTVFRQNTDTTRPTTPPSSSPPNPPAETTTTPAPVAVVPAQPGLIESTASGLQGTLVTVLQDAAGVLRRTL